VRSTTSSKRSSTTNEADVTVPDLPDGLYDVRVSLTEDGETEVVASDTLEAALTIVPENAIIGTVTDGDTGEPIEGAIVWLDEGPDTAETGADGYYEFLELEPDTYDVSVVADGYEPETEEDVVLEAGDTQVVDFALDAAVAVDLSDSLNDDGEVETTEANGWWRVQLPFDPRDADQILWVQNGSVYDVTEPGADALYLNPEEDPNTVIDIYYEFDDGWQQLTVQYDADGDLDTIQGHPVAAPDGS
jgi:hypothetical protein